MAPRKPNAHSTTHANSGTLEVAKKAVDRTALKNSNAKAGTDMGMQTKSKLDAALSRQYTLKKKQAMLRKNVGIK